jgi:hypothetical protein
MFWKQKYPVGRGDRDDDDDDDDKNKSNEDYHGEDYVYYSEKEVDESILSFLKSDEEEEEEEEEQMDAEHGADNDDGDEEEEEDSSYAPSSINRTQEEADHNLDGNDNATSLATSPYSRLLSNLFFLSGATLYVWTSYYVCDYYQRNGSIPREAINTEIPAQAGENDDDLYELLFQANAKSASSYVTLYMAYSFAASLCWALQGFWNTCFSVGGCRGRIHAVLWTLAALWSLTSSALVLKDSYLSEIFLSVSVHLFAFAALATFCVAKPPSLQGVKCCLPFYCCCCTPVRWLRLADFILILGTLGDVVLSYLNLWKDDLIGNTTVGVTHLLYGNMATAGCWGLCALVYVMVSFGEVCCFSRGHKQDAVDDDQESAKHIKDDQGDDDEESQESNNQNYLPQKAPLTRGPTDDTANDDASVTSFSSWWTAGPATSEGIARSSLDDIFGRH